MRILIRTRGSGRARGGSRKRSRPKKAKKRGGKRARSFRGRLFRLGLLVFLVVSVVGFIRIDRTVAALFAERTASSPSRVYGAPFTLRRGWRVEPTVLSSKLEQLGYVEVAAEPERPGQFSRDKDDWTIFLHSAPTAGGSREAFPVFLDVRRGKLRRTVDLRDRSKRKEFSLEPEPLLTFYADVQEERRWTPLKAVPRVLQAAVETVEDRRFRDHYGVDLIGTARALLTNVRSGRILQGGSTITQQLVKNLYGPGERTLRRKLVEAVGAVSLELHEDKKTILEAYLNEVYLGQLGPVAISGVGDAARFYFGADVRDLDLSRSALLAGMIRNPGRYHPRRHPDEAKERRDLVLELMHERELIDDDALRVARGASLGVRPRPANRQRFPWIEDFLAREFAPVAPEAVPSRAGYSIFTTFDPRVQEAAREALRSGLERLEKRLGRTGNPPLQGAIVVLRPYDGALLAMVGGRDYGRSQYNRAVQAHRPPGSTFKPFVYLAGFERARRERDFDFNLATVLEDEPLELRSGGRDWRPANYDGRFRGPVSAREALEKSINVPTVRAAMQIGLPEVIDVARQCGIESDLQAVPSLAIGTGEVTPLELAAAYGTLANGGWRAKPHGLTAVIDRAGEAAELPDHEIEQAVDPVLAYLVTDALQGVFQRGTARSSASLGFHGQAAGKTGSSDDLRDAWFVGYRPEILALVWVGYDDNRPVGLSGAAGALPIWVDLMRRLGIEGNGAFPKPGGLVRGWVDPDTGQLAVRGCPNSREEIFARGTRPVEVCELHEGRKKKRSLWKRIFGT